MIFCLKNTNNCFKTKLFKLLYFIDFNHFKIKGRPVTCFEYNAWPKGPVPVNLNDEIDNPQTDFKEFFNVHKNSPEKKGVQLIPRVKFNEDLFSARELKIMKDICETFKYADSDMMIDSTHLRNDPWDITYNKKNLKQKKIPYTLALDDSPESLTEEELKEIQEDRLFVKQALGNEG